MKSKALSPDVSVIVCTYNHGKWIERCLRSLVNQDFIKNDKTFTWFDVQGTETRKYVQGRKIKFDARTKTISQPKLAIGRELEKNGKVEGEDFWWMVKTDEGHGFYKEANKMELYSELEEFFGRYLKDS